MLNAILFCQVTKHAPLGLHDLSSNGIMLLQMCVIFLSIFHNFPNSADLNSQLFFLLMYHHQEWCRPPCGHTATSVKLLQSTDSGEEKKNKTKLFWFILTLVETTQVTSVKRQQQIKTNKQTPPDTILTTPIQTLSKRSLFLHYLPGSLLKKSSKEEIVHTMVERGREGHKTAHILKSFTWITIYPEDKQQNLKVHYLGKNYVCKYYIITLKVRKQTKSY